MFHSLSLAHVRTRGRKIRELSRSIEKSSGKNIASRANPSDQFAEY